MKITSQHFFSRELSWLSFNQRVLEEAKSPANPLLERLKFLAITASNLDEFFMVRVGGLQMLHQAGRRKSDAAGFTPLQQLKAVRERTREMVSEQYECYRSELEPALAKASICRVTADHLDAEQQLFIDQWIKEEVYPVLTPSARTDRAPPPAFRNLQLYMLIRLAPAEGSEEERFATLPVGAPFERLVDLPSEQGYAFILLEDVIRKTLPRWFSGVEIKECALFRITRNADIAVREDEASDLLSDMESILEERRGSDCVRIEIEANASRTLQNKLCDLLDAAPENIIRIDGPLDLKDFMKISFIDGFDQLKSTAQNPQQSAMIDRNEPMFDQIADHDLLLHHPYESFNPVVRFIREAADDPSVLAIKQVLYRTSADSPIITALADAAQTGKSVTALVELKARFDEERNIGWAQILEQAGVQVVYGVRGLKTHSKVCLIVRREPQGIVRYVHYGTGNYNDATAKLYSDISYMTCNDLLGADASLFFNAVCGYSQPTGLSKAGIAPLTLRSTLIEMIDGEIERSRQGQKAIILAKFNALTDDLLITKLYEASRAGVEIKLNVRGICCLKPGIPKLSENIRVISIVGRYLEHARICCFHHGGDEKVFISSADWMQRNLDKRVELLIPVEDRRSHRRLVEILKIHFNDTVKSWTLLADGNYARTSALPGKRKPVDSQQVFYDLACKAVTHAAKTSRTTLRPHRPAPNK